MPTTWLVTMWTTGCWHHTLSAVCKSPVATQTITKLSGCLGSRHQAIVNDICHKILLNASWLWCLQPLCTRHCAFRFSRPDINVVSEPDPPAKGRVQRLILWFASHLSANRTCNSTLTNLNHHHYITSILIGHAQIYNCAFADKGLQRCWLCILHACLCCVTSLDPAF